MKAEEGEEEEEKEEKEEQLHNTMPSNQEQRSVSMCPPGL